MKKSNIRIRKAKKEDCKEIAELINNPKNTGLLIPKNANQIMTQIPFYFVADNGGQLVGNCGFKIWPDGKVEIISLVVTREFQSLGLGKRLIKRCLRRAKAYGFVKIFALTTSPDLFKKLGFKTIPYRRLPGKIWQDCVNCPRNAGKPGDVKCNEVAVAINF